MGRGTLSRELALKCYDYLHNDELQRGFGVLGVAWFSAMGSSIKVLDI